MLSASLLCGGCWDTEQPQLGWLLPERLLPGKLMSCEHQACLNCSAMQGVHSKAISDNGYLCKSYLHGAAHHERHTWRMAPALLQPRA